MEVASLEETVTQKTVEFDKILREKANCVRELEDTKRQLEIANQVLQTTQRSLAEMQFRENQNASSHANVASVLSALHKQLADKDVAMIQQATLLQTRVDEERVRADGLLDMVSKSFNLD